MGKIKIVHLVNDLGLSGTGKVVAELCNLFVGEKYEISVVSLSNNIPLAKMENWPAQVQVFSFDYYYEEDYSLRKYFQLLYKKSITEIRGKEIIQKIASLSPSILHCHLQPRELIIAILVNRIKPVKLLFTDHLVRISDNEYSHLKRKMLAFVYRRIYKSFHVTAVSQDAMKSHKHFGLINKKKLYFLIENKIDVELFSHIKRTPKNSLAAIYIARLAPVKAHDLLLDALTKIEENIRPHMCLVGGGELELSLKKKTEFLNLTNWVTFTGEVEDVTSYLKEADIGIFPSYKEGLPLALLEKMASGLPVITSDIPELKRMIKDKENGLLFKSGSSESLALKMKTMLEDSELRNKLGENARSFVSLEFDKELWLSEYSNTYAKLLQY